MTRLFSPTGGRGGGMKEDAVGDAEAGGGEADVDEDRPRTVGVAPVKTGGGGGAVGRGILRRSRV